jgi:hypothetical protein
MPAFDDGLAGHPARDVVQHVAHINVCAPKRRPAVTDGGIGDHETPQGFAHRDFLAGSQCSGSHRLHSRRGVARTSAPGSVRPDVYGQCGGRKAISLPIHLHLAEFEDHRLVKHGGFALVER